MNRVSAASLASPPCLGAWHGPSATIPAASSPLSLLTFGGTGAPAPLLHWGPLHRAVTVCSPQRRPGFQDPTTGTPQGGGAGSTSAQVRRQQNQTPTLAGTTPSIRTSVRCRESGGHRLPPTPPARRQAQGRGTVHRPQSGGPQHRFSSLPRTRCRSVPGTEGDVPGWDAPSPAQRTTFCCRSGPIAAYLLLRGRAQDTRTDAIAGAQPQLCCGFRGKGQTSCFRTTPPHRLGQDRHRDSVAFEGG
ncbi:hypothetical protein NDU88_000194 [Pleurodeles waltl]|uniref:Uncharacterized protein n=1 Tax=Pleurodeles waltl TaxID=8319 RepID=A0AAV7VVF0_PLEWA|nr:hypothetical protein NDU88_000194 [Pleurodeles waltl]